MALAVLLHLVFQSGPAGRSFIGGGFWPLDLFAATSTHQVIATNARPTSSAIVVNGGGVINLTGGATTTVLVGFTVSDNNGCGDVLFKGNVTSSLFRGGAGLSCLASTLNCYVVASSSVTHNCPSATTTQVSANATATFQIYYFADATDASSTYPDDGWSGGVFLMDASASSTSASSSYVELNTLLAIDVAPTSTSYGTVFVGGNTTSTNREDNVLNKGNSSTSVKIHGTAFVSGANSFATSSQHYATSTFTFGGAEQALQSAATLVAGFLAPGLPLGPSWTKTTSMPLVLRLHAAVAYNQYLYAIAGNTTGGVTTSSVFYAPLNGDGTAGNWSYISSLPSAIEQHGAAAGNGYLYTLGGVKGGSETSTVFYAPINANGSLGNWSSTTALPGVIFGQIVDFNNGYVYSAGGNTGSEVTSTVYYAAINGDGSISNWSSTSPMPSPVYQGGGGIDNSYIYSVGGLFGSVTSSVFYAPINSTGSLGVWSTGTSLPAPRDRHAVIAAGGIIYAIGGADSGSNNTSSVLFAPLNTDGSVGNWADTTPIPFALRVLASAVSKGYIYNIGGFTGTSTSTVNVISRNSRSMFWGLEVPTDAATGSYTSTITYTAAFNP